MTDISAAGTTEKFTQTDAQGMFSLIDEKGKNLGVHVSKDGAALTDYNLTIDNYVLTQATVPAGGYDVSVGQNDPNSINGYARFWAKEASNPTPDFADDLGYRGYLAALNASGNVVNFHNFDDFALASGRALLERVEVNWEANEESYKPDGSFSNTNWYTYVPSNPDSQRCQLVDAVIVGRFVADPHESMALVARPRSKAVGARAGVQGSIDNEFNLATAPLEFSPSSDAHISKPCPISELCSGKSPVFRESHGISKPRISAKQSSAIKLNQRSESA